MGGAGPAGAAAVPRPLGPRLFATFSLRSKLALILLRVADGVGTQRAVELDGRSPGGGSRSQCNLVARCRRRRQRSGLVSWMGGAREAVADPSRREWAAPGWG